MKKTNWLKKIIFSTFMVIAIHIEAQICPSFLIKNTSTICQVQISYKIFNGGNCTTVCSGSGITLSPLGTYAVSASCISSSTNIELIVDFGGGSISAPVNFG